MQLTTLLRSALVLLLVAALAACGEVTGTGDPNVAATVNGSEITVDQVEERFEGAKAQPQVAQQLESDTDGAYESSIQAQILSQLVASELLEQWAEDLNLEAGEEEIAQERESLIEEIGGQEAFDQAVEQSGLSEDDVKQQIRQQVLQKKISEEVAGDGEVSDEEVEAFYEENAEARFGEKATARHILVEDKAKADKLFKQIQDGGDFAKIAEAESTDPGSAAEGGELPPFGRGQMVGPFDKAVFGSDVGELVGPVKTEFGYHIIEVLEKTPGQTLEEASEEIRAELSQSQSSEELQAELAERTKEAEVTVNPRFGEWNPETGQVEPDKPLGETSESSSEGAGAPGGGSEIPLPPTEASS